MKERRVVVLTVRQARFLLLCAHVAEQRWGMTPMERLLVGAAQRRVENAGRKKAQKAQKG